MNLPDYIEKINEYISMVQETDSITKDILKNRVAKYLHEISEISFIPLYRRPTFNSPNDASQNNGHKSSPADDTERNKDLTNHLERQHSIYLEANATNPQSYKKYLERSEPHKIQVIETIYKYSQFIAASICEIITVICSRYLM